MAIVDRINEMAVDLGGDPTGGTIEDALNNLQKVSGGGNNEIVIRCVTDNVEQRNYCLCNKTLPELVDMITSDGKTMDFSKASIISAKLIDDYVVKSDTGPVHIPSIRPMFVHIPDDPEKSSYNFDFDEFQSIKNSLKTDFYIQEYEKNDSFRSLLKLVNATDGSDGFFIGYKNPNSLDFDHRCYIISTGRTAPIEG